MPALAPSRTILPVLGLAARFTKLAERNPGVVPIDYWTEGILTTDVRLGEAVWMARDKRAPRDGEVGDQERIGLFNTSAVESITEEGPGEWNIITRNSTWRLTMLRAECDPLYRPELAPRPRQ